MATISPFHLTPLTGKASFGLGPVVLNLASQQQGLGLFSAVGCFDQPAEARALETKYHLSAQTIHSFPVAGPFGLGYSPELEHYLAVRAKQYDLVHQHGIWTGISRATNRYRAVRKGPTVITLHGFLDVWALKKSSWRKQLALLCYERENLHNATCLHALSSDEAKGVRAFGLSNPIAIIPNGITVEWLQHTGAAELFRRKFNLTADLKLMLFLGRITPKKGLPMLLQAMHRLRERLTGWQLLIAGVDEFNHRQTIEQLIISLSLDAYVQFIGPQFDQDKQDAFAAADLFVLPSHSEGAPIAILEALGAGVPVLTTKASPWEELISQECGWWTEISVEAITHALQNVLQQPQTKLREMGQRGKQLVSQKYTWPQVAQQVLILYEWLLNGGEQPDFVITE